MADRIICRIGTATSCIPEFWLSLLLLLVFAVWLDWLPGSGAYSVGKERDMADRAAHLILPLAVVVLAHLWYYAFQVRNRLLEEVRADYVLLARMKGLSGKQVLYRHCLRGGAALLSEHDGCGTAPYTRRYLCGGNGVFLSGHRHSGI